jgi:hypothetical protein
MISRRTTILFMLAGATACAGASTSSPPSAAPGATPATRAPAQPKCETPDDYIGTSMSATFVMRPEPLYAAGSEALRGLGYAVLENSPPRELLTAPSYAWPAGTETEAWHGSEHPGVELSLFTRATGDSTQVTIGARALCLVRGPGEATPTADVGKSLESVVTLQAMNAFLRQLQRGP